MKNSLLFLFLCFSLHLNAQTNWTQANDFPANTRYAAIDFVVNDEAYLLGGLVLEGTAWTAFNSVWKFDQAKDTWSVVGTYPGAKMFGGVSFVIDKIAFVGLGANQNGVQKKQLYAYNAQSNTWQQKADFPGSTRTFGFAFVAKGKGYIGAGISTGDKLLNDVWEYDPATDTWTEKKSYPGGGRVGLAAFSLDNKGYVGSGDDKDFFYNDFYAYDPDANTWETKATFPGINKSYNNCVSVGNTGYLVGGEKGAEVYTTQMWFYNAKFNTWKQSKTFLGTARAAGNFFYVNNSLYYGMGLIGPTGASCSNSFWKIDFNTVGIESAAVMPDLSIFPNPTTQVIHVDLGQIHSEVTVTLHSIDGRLIKEVMDRNTDLVSLKVNESPGIYMLTVFDGVNKSYTRVEVQ